MSATMNPDLPGDGDDRRTWLMATSAMGVAAAAGVAIPLVSSFAPSERAKAQGAAVEVDIAGLAPGQMVTAEWRGKPVWVLHRTPEMLASLEKDTADLADPASAKDQQPDYAKNSVRSRRPEIFVAVGICTHLGCSPVTLPSGTANPSVPANWPGGFFCPCHGSTFDFAGRVFKNKPAPSNLEVPRYAFLSDTRIVVGEDETGAA